jgi:hypothetical protein
MVPTVCYWRADTVNPRFILCFRGLDSKIPQVVVGWPYGSKNKGCEVTVTKYDWKSQTFHLVSTMDMLYDGDKTCHAVLSYKKKMNGKVEASGEIGRVRVVAKDMDKKAVCMFVGNMLTTTFDGQ